jgi:hypothetical protein
LGFWRAGPEFGAIVGMLSRFRPQDKKRVPGNRIQKIVGAPLTATVCHDFSYGVFWVWL